MQRSSLLPVLNVLLGPYFSGRIKSWKPQLQQINSAGTSPVLARFLMLDDAESVNCSHRVEFICTHTHIHTHTHTHHAVLLNARRQVEQHTYERDFRQFQLPTHVIIAASTNDSPVNRSVLFREWRPSTNQIKSTANTNVWREYCSRLSQCDWM